MEKYKANQFSLIIITLSIMFVSCKPEVNKPINIVEEGISVHITHAAGDQYNNGFLPLLGNIGKVDNENGVEVLILSVRLNVNTSYNVDPVALLKYNDGKNIRQLIVAVPTNIELRTLEIDNLVDLSVKYANVKRIIEQWYNSYNGLGQNMIQGWENKTAAINVLTQIKENRSR